MFYIKRGIKLIKVNLQQYTCTNVRTVLLNGNNTWGGDHWKVFRLCKSNFLLLCSVFKYCLMIHSKIPHIKGKRTQFFRERKVHIRLGWQSVQTTRLSRVIGEISTCQDLCTIISAWCRERALQLTCLRGVKKQKQTSLCFSDLMNLLVLRKHFLWFETCMPFYFRAFIGHILRVWNSCGLISLIYSFIECVTNLPYLIETAFISQREAKSTTASQ